MFVLFDCVISRLILIIIDKEKFGNVVALQLEQESIQVLCLFVDSALVAFFNTGIGVIY